MDKNIECRVCGMLYSELEAEDVKNCPNCATRVAPKDHNFDVTITLNWEDIARSPDGRINSGAHKKKRLVKIRIPRGRD